MSDQGPKPLYWLPFLLTFIAALGIYIGSEFFGSAERSSKEIQKLDQIFQVLDNQYVDKINKEEILKKQFLKCCTVLIHTAIIFPPKTSNF